MTDGPIDSPLFDLSEAAAYLKTGERHVRDLWNRREIAGVKIGRLLRFPRVDLDRYIEANTTAAVR